MRLFLVLGLMMLALPLPAWAQSPALDFDDPLKSAWAVQDNPRAAVEGAEAAIKAADRAKDPVAWARRIAIFAQAANDDWEKNSVQHFLAEFPAANAILQENQLYRHSLLLQFSMLDNNQTPEQVVKQYRQLASQAAEHKEPELQTQMLFKLAFDLTDSAPDEALAALQEGHRIMQQTPGFNEVYAALLKSQSALALDRMDQTDRALRLLEEVDAFLRTHPLRYFTGIMNYNYGAILMSRPSEEIYPKALAAYQRSSAAAAAIQDESTTASSLLGQAQIANTRGQFNDALGPTAQAAQIFLKLKDFTWAGEAYKRRSVALVGLKRYAEALESLRNAERHLPEEAADQRDLAFNRAAAYAGLEDFAQAYQQQQKFMSLDAELKRKKMDMNYAKQLADLGLEVETQRNARLQEENQRQAEALGHAAQQRLLILVLLGLAIFALIEAREVRRSRNKMQRILDHIDEGILTIGRDLRIESGYSRHLSDLFQTQANLAGQDALHLLLDTAHLNPEQRSMVRGTLQACLGEEPLTWDLNEGQLPTELIYGEKQDRILTAHWTPIIDQQKIRRILLSLRDVTARRGLEREVDKAKKRNESLQVKVSELIDAELDQAMPLFKEADQLLQHMSQTSEVEVLRHLHTLKGAARTLGLKSMSGSLHALESACQTHDTREILAAATAALQHVAEYQHLVTRVFHYGEAAPVHSRQRSLCDSLRHLVPDLSRRAQEQGLPYGGFLIKDAIGSWPEALLSHLQPILLHALNNSLDHGFLFPKKRGESIDPVLLEVEAAQKNAMLELTIRDNGNGLNLQKLRQKPGLAGASDAELLNSLFQDGQSTAEITTTTSGRGVGLAAVRSLVLEARGAVSLRQRSGNRGTELHVSLPWPTRNEHG